MSSSPPKYSFPWLAARYNADDVMRIYRDIQARKGRHSTISMRGGALIESWPETPPKDKKNLKKNLKKSLKKNAEEEALKDVNSQ